MESETDIPDSDSGYAFLSEVQFKARAPTGDQLLQLVRDRKVKKVLDALVDGTDPNVGVDQTTGDSALHIAVEKNSEVLVRMLIVFEADLKRENYDGQTALDLANINKFHDIASDINKVLQLRKELDRDPSKERYRPGCGDGEAFLLSLDGGGIRGLVFVQVLIEIEKRRKHRYPHSNPLLSQFNWVTGNSTGGIAALAFTASNMGLCQGRKMYFQLKDEVLGGDPPFPNKKVDKVFQNVFYQHKMCEIKGRNVSVMTTLAKTSPAILHIMSNYGGPRNGEQPPSEQLVWKAARATSSVPLFFHPQDDIYLDGGLIANNPTTDAIVDMFEHDKDVKLKLVLSLGCGISKPKGIDDVDFKQNPKIVDFICDHILKSHQMQEAALVLRNFKAVKEVVEILKDQITQPNGQVLARSKFIAEKVGANYFRINPDIADVSFLTTDDKILINMLFGVTCYMLENCHKITDPVLDCVYGV